MIQLNIARMLCYTIFAERQRRCPLLCLHRFCHLPAPGDYTICVRLGLLGQRLTLAACDLVIRVSLVYRLGGLGYVAQYSARVVRPTHGPSLFFESLMNMLH